MISSDEHELINSINSYKNRDKILKELGYAILKNKTQFFLYLRVLIAQLLGKTVVPGEDQYSPKKNEWFFKKTRQYFTGVEKREIVTYRTKMTFEAIQDCKGFKKIIDFGIHYGYMCNELAIKYPSIEVLGTERDNGTIELNRSEFKKKNLNFIS